MCPMFLRGTDTLYDTVYMTVLLLHVALEIFFLLSHTTKAKYKKAPSNSGDFLEQLAQLFCHEKCKPIVEKQ